MRFATQDSAIALALLTFVDTASAASRKPSQAVLLADIRSLTLRADKLTTARRVDAIPQVRYNQLHKVQFCTKRRRSSHALAARHKVFTKST